MPRVGLEPTIPVFERAKTVYCFDSTATVIGSQMTMSHKVMSSLIFLFLYVLQRIVVSSRVWVTKDGVWIGNWIY
jgi:hypothetical protein